MRKLILLIIAALAIAPAAYSGDLSFYVGDGTETPDTWDQTDGDAFVAADLEVDGNCDLDGDVDIDGDVTLPDGVIDNPAWEFESDPDNGPYLGAADSIYWTINGVHVGTIDGTGWSGDIATGDIGTVTPGLGTFTDIMGSGDFYYGGDPGDIHTGYRRTETIKHTDTFDVGNDADLAVRWDVTNVVGAGTNDETTTDGWNTLTTGGAGGPDSESTVSNGLHANRLYTPRLEIVVDIGTLAGSEFFFGFYKAANDYAEMRYDASTDGNWHLSCDDTAGADDVDSGVAATTDPTKLEIWTAADGTLGWAIDDVELATTGMTNQMTAGGFYTRYYGAEEAAAARVFAVDYYVHEQLKMQ